MMNAGYSLADISAATNGNRGNGFLGDFGAWIILFLIFGIFGWGGFGGIGGGTGGVANGYVLQSDFATIQRQLSDGFNAVDNALDKQNTGLCDLGYETLRNFNNLGMNVMQGFNAMQSQVADCCCKTQTNIKDVDYNIATQGAILGRQIEKGFADTNYAMATQNCQTLQAIDKVGDRVIDYLANKEAQALRDENQALRLAASQQAQNNYIVSALRPYPVPAFNVPNPFGYMGNNGCCGCNA